MKTNGSLPRLKVRTVPGKRDEPEAAEQATGAELLEPGSPKAGGSETVNLTLLSAQTAVPRTLRLLVAQSFHFFQRGDKKGKIISAVKSCWRCRHSHPRSTRREVGAGHSEAQENSLLKQTCPQKKLGDQGQTPQSQTCNQDLMAGCHVGAKAVCPHCFNNLVPGQFQPFELSFGQL